MRGIVDGWLLLRVSSFKINWVDQVKLPQMGLKECEAFQTASLFYIADSTCRRCRVTQRAAAPHQ